MTAFQNQPEDQDLSSTAVASIVRLWNGRPVRLDRLVRLSLTDMWKACGCEFGNKPAEWLSNKAAKRFHNLLLQEGNSLLVSGTGFASSDANPALQEGNSLLESETGFAGSDANHALQNQDANLSLQDGDSRLVSGTGLEPHHILEVIHGGPNAGTWACIELALAYAMYLDEQFGLWVLRTFVQARTGQLVPAALTQAIPQAPTSFDPAPLMAKLDALTARLDAMQSAPSLAPAEMERVIREAIERGVESAISNSVLKLVPPISVELAADMEKVFEKSLLDTVPQVCKSAEDHQYFVSRKLHLLSLNWLHKVVGDILAERRAAESEAVPLASPSPVPTEKAVSDGFARVMDAVWMARGAKPARATEIVALAEEGLFNADSPQGRALQFAREASRREGMTFSVQDGSVQVTLRASARKPGVARQYWLEPKL